MSTTIDQKVVEMRFDNGQFERGITQSLNSLDKLKASLNFGNLGSVSGINNFSVSISGIGKVIDEIQNKFLSLVNIVRATSIIKFVSRITDSLLELRSAFTTDQIVAGWYKFEEITKSTQTIMAATRQEWEDEVAHMEYVGERIEQLRWYADETSYSLLDMTSNVGKFTSAGVDLDLAVTAMQGISSWAAISGAGINEASRAMYNLAQAMSMGGVYLRDWMSIENANMATREFKDTAIQTALALGTLVYNEDEDLIRTLTGQVVTLENFRTTLNSQDGNWFNSEVLTATLEKYGEFPNLIKKATDVTGIQTTKMLKYAEDYKNEMRALQKMTDETGISVSDWKGYIRDFQSGSTKFAAQLGSIAEKYGLTEEQFIEYLKSYKNGIIDWGAIAEAEDVDLGSLIHQLDILTDSEYDLGMAAFKAGQESRTLTDALNYTKDAISSGWYKTFELIFGRLLDAKEVFTTVTEELYDVFVAGGERRNEILEDWNKLGGNKVLLESLMNLWTNFKNILFSVKDGFREVFPASTGESLLALTEKFRTFTEGLMLSDSKLDNIKAGIAGLTTVLEVFWYNLKVIALNAWQAYKEIFPNSDWTNTFKSFGEALGHVAEKFRLSAEGGEKVKSIFRGVFAVFDMLKNLLIAILEPIVGVTAGADGLGSKILDVAAGFGEWLVNLDETTKANDTFRKVVAQVVEFIKKIPDYLDAISMALFDMHLDELWEKIKQGALDAWEAIKNFFINLPENARKVTQFLFDLSPEELWEKIKQGVRDAWAAIKQFFEELPDKAQQLSQALFGMRLEELWEKIKQGVRDATDKVREFFEKLNTPDENGDTAFDRFCKKIEEIREKLEEFKESVKPIFDWINEHFGIDFDAGFSMENLGNSLKTGGLLATMTIFGVALYKFITFIDDFRDSVKDPKSVVGNAKEIMGGLSSALQSFKTNKDTKSIKTVATAVLEMAAAIILLGAMDTVKMGQGLYAISVVTGELVAAMVIINKTTSNSSKLLKCAEAMEKFALSMLGVSAAIAILALIGDPTSIIIATDALALLFGELAAAMIVLDKNMPRSDKMAKLAEAMTLLSVSMILIAGAIDLIGAIGDIGLIITATGALAVAFGAIVASLILLDQFDVNPKKAQSFADTIAIIGVAMIELGVAMAIMQGMSWEQMLAAAAALAILLGGVTAALILASKFGAINEGMLVFAGAVAIIGVGALAAGVGLYLMAEALEKVVTLIQGGSEKTAEAIEKTKSSGNGLSGLFNDIIEILGSLGGVFEAAGALVVSFFTGIAKAITSNRATLTQGLTDLWMIFVDTFKAVVPEMVDGLKIAIESFVDMLTELWPKIETFLLMAGATALALLKQLILSLLDILKEAMPDILEITKMALIGITEIIMELTPMLFEHIKMVLEGLLDIGYEYLPKFTQFAIDMLIDTLTRIKDNIGEVTALLTEIALETIFGTLDGITAELPHIMESIWTFVITLIETFADGLDEHAVELREAILHLMESLWNAIKEFFGINSPSTKFFDMAGDMIQGMINGLNDMIESAVAAITKLADDVLTAICNFFGVDKPTDASEFGKLGIDIINQLKDGINSMISKLKEKIREAADGMLTKFCEILGIDKPKDKQEFQQFGIKVIQQLNAGIYSMLTKAKNMIGSVADGMVEKAHMYIEVFKAAGYNLIDGLKQGIKNAAYLVTSAVKSVGDDAIYTVKSVLGIASPSKVFAEIGRYVDEGLAGGISSYASKVDDAVEDVGYGAINSMSSVIASISDAISNDMDSQPTIRPVLDLTDVVRGASAINGMFSSDKTMNLAAQSSVDINTNIVSKNNTAEAFESLRNTLSGISGNQNGIVQNNTFNISGEDPRAIAEEVSNILQRQVERQGAVWA